MQLELEFDPAALELLPGETDHTELDGVVALSCSGNTCGNVCSSCSTQVLVTIDAIEVLSRC
jgi:hypothetical protein